MHHHMPPEWSGTCPLGNEATKILQAAGDLYLPLQGVLKTRQTRTQMCGSTQMHTRRRTHLALKWGRSIDTGISGEHPHPKEHQAERGRSCERRHVVSPERPPHLHFHSHPWLQVTPSQVHFMLCLYLRIGDPFLWIELWTQMYLHLPQCQSHQPVHISWFSAVDNSQTHK